MVFFFLFLVERKGIPLFPSLLLVRSCLHAEERRRGGDALTTGKEEKEESVLRPPSASSVGHSEREEQHPRAVVEKKDSCVRNNSRDIIVRSRVFIIIKVLWTIPGKCVEVWLPQKEKVRHKTKSTKVGQESLVCPFFFVLTQNFRRGSLESLFFFLLPVLPHLSSGSFPPFLFRLEVLSILSSTLANKKFLPRKTFS